VLLHNLEFFISQRSGLLQNIVVNADLADIVKQGGDSNLLDFFVRQLKSLSDGYGKARDAL
jgi:hypothetical protein